ncbi:MAG: RluA family pseudouridine synthase [bacterium]
MKPEDLHILFEDNHLLAIIKPAGLLVQGDRTGDSTVLDLAKAYLRKKYAKPGKVFLGLVHRLDRPVSGVLLLARTSKAASRLSAQFRAGTVGKRYLAVVTGRPDPPRDEPVAFLAGRADRHGRTEARREPFPGAREARLWYQVLEQSGKHALVEVRPVTGRRHQIRAQLALLGWPILGDVKYGAVARLPDRVVALHARELEIAHPVSGETVRLQAALPSSWPWPPR